MKTQVYKTLRTFGINLFKKQGLLMLTLAALISVNSLLSQTQSVPFAVTFMGDVVLKGEEENLIPTAIYAVAGSTRTSPLDVMGAGTTIATSDYRAMEWVNDGTAIGTIYVATNSGGNKFGTLNPVTGDFTLIANTAVDIIGLGWNPITQTMYASAANGAFGTLNLTNGELTQIGSNLSPAVTITIDNDGVCYAQGIASGRGLGIVNLTTGVFTQARANNVTAFTGMLAVDRETNEVYATTFNGTTIQKINKTSSTLAGTNTGTSFPSRVLAWTIIGKATPMTPTYTVNITSVTNGTITVMSGDNPVADGDVLAEGTVLTLTAIPDTGYVFEKWWDDNTNATHTHTLTENVTISATFEAIPTYTVTIIPTTNGTITVMNNATPINSGDALLEGTILSLIATPDAGYKLENWWDNNTSATRTIILTKDTAISATFEEILIPTTIYAVAGSTRTSPLDVMGAGTTIATSDYRAMEWVNDGTAIGTIYVATSSEGNKLGTLNPVTGDFTLIANTAVDIVGLGWNPITQTMYASAANGAFGTLNLTNGELTQIGSNLSPAVTITIDNDGVCYAQGIASGRGLGTVNLTTGVFTQARANNVTAFTGMLAVDRGTNEVYATTFNGTTIQKINKTSSTLAGTNTGTSFPSRVLAWTIIGKPIPMTPTYTVNITPATNGTITVMSGDNPVADGDVLAEGTILTLTAIPGTGYVFEKWWDDNTNATRTHTLTENVTISATFEAIPTYTVTIIPPANGIITVMNDTSAVNTGDQLEEGTILTLSVMPDTDYEFAQWWDGNTENPRSITLNSDIAIGATFEAIPIYYTVTITPGIGGIITVMSDEDEVFHGDELEEGTELTLIATAHEGFKFVEWWHGGTDETHIHILDDHVTISATFTDDQTSIVVTTSRELFVVFPSPTTDLLHIQTEEMIQQIVILDLNGKVMMQLQGNRKILDLQSLPIGNYIVRIHTKTAIVPIKIVKQ